ncbi:MAG: AMP-binding protein [Desulfarculaceae bacterium]|nr:AMP-binding protein [Desulfarculaceae bacterium]MCF8071635.1 AMP-binding protein [Desulfarculaceae bacterium]MCF8103168.1 AMP-binding protein [Desulfarculaceae bacterium]
MERARIPREAGKANLPDYEKARREFSWDQVAAEFTWHQTGRLNMVHEAIDRWAQEQRGEQAALRVCHGDRCTNYSFRQLRDDSSRLANLFRGLGLETGQRLAILLPPMPEIFLAMAACARLGAVYCCLPPRLNRDQLAHCLEALEPRVILTTPELAEGLPPGPRPEGLRLLYLREPPGGMDQEDASLAALLPQQRDHCEPVWVDTRHPLSIAFVSGEYGPARMVTQAHGAMSGHLVSARWVLDLKDDSLLWCDFEPWGVAAGVYGAWAPWLCGVASLLQASAGGASTWYRTLEEHRVTTLYTSPERLRRLQGEGDDLPGRYDLSSLQHLATMGEPLDAKLFFWTRNNLGLPPHDTWWSADSGIITLANLPCLDIKLASCGKPLPGVEAAVVDVAGQPQNLLTLGRLGLKGQWPGQSLESEKRPRFDGWLLRGDLALVDEDGYFYIQGRSDDLLRVHDETVGPYEVERLLLRREEVEQAAVIAAPGPEHRPVFKAFVVLAPSQSPGGQLRQELLQFARSRLAPFVPLAGLEFLSELPRNGSRRLLRRALRAQDLGLPLGDISLLE